MQSKLTHQNTQLHAINSQHHAQLHQLQDSLSHEQSRT